MKCVAGLTLIAAAFLMGCGENVPPTDRREVVAAPTAEQPNHAPAAQPAAQPAAGGNADAVVATVKGEPVTMRQLMDPLVRSHGLTVLANLARLDLARQWAVRDQVTVTEKDFEDEFRLTQDKLFKDADDARLLDALDKATKEHRDADVALLRAELKTERDQFLEQFLTNQHIDRVEYDLVLRINTYLRKIAEPQVQKMIFDPKRPKDEALQTAFGKMFGERIYVQYMALTNMDEVNEVKRRLAANEKFEDIAKQMSHDKRTGALGGELPPFTRAERISTDEKLSSVFKDTAFSLKDGEISDVVMMGNWFDLIKRLRVKPPEKVKFEDVRDTVYQSLHDGLMDTGLKDLKRQLDAEVTKEMKILDPILLGQYNEKIERQAGAEKKAKDNLARQERVRELTNPASTQPAMQEIKKLMTTAPTTTTTNEVKNEK